LCLVEGTLDEGRTREVAARLARSGRRGSLPILVDFFRLVRLEVEQRTAILESAVPLPADVRDDLSAWLASAHGPAVRVIYALDPTLVAGVRIKVGSHVYDGSVRGRLAALEARF
jgi:F-type H+-transporting ATPase subunit delta